MKKKNNIQEIVDFKNIGNVAIVDDDIEEIKDLMHFLSKFSIPFNLYDGKVANFPTKKTNIRLVFLDLGINGTIEPKMLASGMVTNLNALIDENNGPYALALWSNNYLQNKDIINEYISKVKNPPEFYFDMEKSLIRTISNEEVLLEELNKKLNQGFEKNSLTNATNIFSHLYQTQLNKSIVSLSNDGFNQIDNSKKLSALINFVADEYFGKLKTSISKNEKIVSFFEYLSTYVSSKFNNSLINLNFENIINFDENIDHNYVNKAVIKTEIHINEKINNRYPKNVYRIRKNTKLKQQLTDGIFATKTSIKSFINVQIDVTHTCWIAQCKEKYHTMMTGLLLEGENIQPKGGSTYKESIINLGEIIFNNKKYNFICFTNHLCSIHENKLNSKKAIFSLNNQMFDNIRGQLASQYAKVGI